MALYCSAQWHGCDNAEQIESLVQTWYCEQVRKLRISIAPKGRGHMTDATSVMRGIVLRQAFYAHLWQTLPKLSDSIANSGLWEWFHEVYGM